MTTIGNAGSLSGVKPGLLDRERHYRDGGFQSLVGAAGGTVYPSVYRHGLRLQRVLAAAVASDSESGIEGSLRRHVADDRAFYDHL